MIGETVGHFRIIEKLGEGGMGEVYLADDTSLDRRVALKILPKELQRDSIARKRFLREAKSAASLDHPFICNIHLVGEEGDTTFIAMEYIKGQTLKDRLATGSMTLKESLKTAIEIVEALSTAHGEGIVHRDLKPSNIMLMPDGHVKIMDFGLAKQYEPIEGREDEDITFSASLTQDGHMLGTLAYMSPEQLRGQQTDPRSDIFSFGVLLFEMLSGRHPFKRDLPMDTASAVLSEAAPSISDFIEDPPDLLHHILRKMLTKSPNQRYQSAGEVLIDLTHLLEDTTKLQLTSIDNRNLTLRWIIPASAVIVLLAVSIMYLLRSGRRESVASTAFEAVPFPTTIGIEERNTAWSPLGNLIAYDRQAEDSWDIWICDPNGTSHRKLTEGFEQATWLPAWSPDGSRIAFFSDRGGLGIYTMSTIGGDIQKVVDMAGPGLSLQWEAENDLLIYTEVSPDGISNVYSVAPTGGQPECLTAEWPDAEEGSLSPSGEILVFKDIYTIGLESGLHILNLGSGDKNELSRRGFQPRWGADGRSIYFLSKYENTYELWSVAVDPKTGRERGSPVRHTFALDLRNFSLSPDGIRAIVTRNRQSNSIWAIPVEQSPALELTSREILKSDQFEYTFPRWMPDGEGIIFISDQGDGDHIWRLNLGEPVPVRLTSTTGWLRDPLVSSDGRWIAYYDGSHFPKMVRTDGSNQQTLNGQSQDVYKSITANDWSPVGPYLAVNLYESASRSTSSGDCLGILGINPSTGQVSEVRALGVKGYDPFWSPNGDLIVYESVESGKEGIWVTPADGGTPSQVVSIPRYCTLLGWSSNPSLIYFRGSIGDRYGFWSLSVDDRGNPRGEPELWSTTSSRYYSSDMFDIRDNRVLITITEQESDLWLINFPSR